MACQPPAGGHNKMALSDIYIRKRAPNGQPITNGEKGHFSSVFTLLQTHVIRYFLFHNSAEYTHRPYHIAEQQIIKLKTF